MNKREIALVFAGGGAKGAYQAGIIKALADVDARAVAVAGTSIGALNGAITACSPTLKEAAERLAQLWRQAAEQPPISLDMATLKEMARQPLSSDAPRAYLEQYISPELFDAAVPFYVSVFESGGAYADIFRVFLGQCKIQNTKESSYLHIQSLPLADRITAVLASAALPRIYGEQELNGVRYSDGGQGEWFTDAGNTPVEPLLAAGYRNIVVCLLDKESPWHKELYADAYPDANIVELRPSRQLGGRLSAAIVDFRQSTLERWEKQGYDDAMRHKELAALLGHPEGMAHDVKEREAENRAVASKRRQVLELAASLAKDPSSVKDAWPQGLDIAERFRKEVLESLWKVGKGKA